MSQKPETLFRQRVVRDLSEIKGLVIFSIQQKSIQGDPDLLICLKGFFLALELKSAKGKTTKLQEYKLAKIRQARGLAYVVYPDTWDAILNEIIQFERGII